MNSTKLQTAKKQRLKKLIIGYAVFLAAGLAYAAFCMITGYGIPCIFHLITHLKCPGCGVSRMFLCLLRFDFKGAWEANPVILCMLPFFAYLAAVLSVRYVRDGKARLRKTENILVGIACVILVIFGILRNIPFFKRAA